MLKQRVITALILAPLVLWAVLALPSVYLAGIFAIAVLLGAREWAILSGLTQLPGQLLYVLVLAISLYGGVLLLDHAGWFLWFLLACVGWWVVTIIRLSRFQVNQTLSGFSPAQAAEGIIVLATAWTALISVHEYPQDGPLLLVFLLILIWLADIGAYFAGRRWGRVKLAPRVSPGKTREGVYGALLGALLCGIFLAWWQALDIRQAPFAILLCVLTALFSVVGDLFESMLKRLRGVKDSSNLLPGHGGVLDRIDSLTAAAPIFLLGLIMLDKLR